ncbi:hypothetical protein JKP88DRAFT_262763 [Tribonema minus]|uniref:Sulfotransferase n=1 Tax=Tribonema minus TaxID=303371 RepID=A0A835Z7T0_9STRA|nr:hypothetical protein JKP88DRAFT_262763 [Tribonema minus]
MQGLLTTLRWLLSVLACAFLVTYIPTLLSYITQTPLLDTPQVTGIVSTNGTPLKNGADSAERTSWLDIEHTTVMISGQPRRRDTLNELHEVRCPAADMLLLLDRAHCRASDYPPRAAELELRGEPVAAALAHLLRERPWRYHALGAEGGCDHVTRHGGVAVKTIRMNGRLAEFMDAAERVGSGVDLWIHLLRDPRAVLASRLGVTWGRPDNRTYEATFAWADDMCSATMTDLAATEGRPNYKLVQYEHLALHSEATAESVYALLDARLPPEVRAKMQQNDFINHGNATYAEKLAAFTEAVNKPYATSPRKSTKRMNRWHAVLTQPEIDAVQDACCCGGTAAAAAALSRIEACRGARRRCCAYALRGVRGILLQCCNNALHTFACTASLEWSLPEHTAAAAAVYMRCLLQLSTMPPKALLSGLNDQHAAWRLRSTPPWMTANMETGGSISPVSESAHLRAGGRPGIYSRWTHLGEGNSTAELMMRFASFCPYTWSQTRVMHTDGTFCV